MTEASVIAIRALMMQDGVDPDAINVSLRIAEGGEDITTSEACKALKIARWSLQKFCAEHRIERVVRAHRGGSLINAKQLFVAWDEVNGTNFNQERMKI